MLTESEWKLFSAEEFSWVEEGNAQMDLTSWSRKEMVYIPWHPKDRSCKNETVKFLPGGQFRTRSRRMPGARWLMHENGISSAAIATQEANTHQQHK
jgi:hypothetical protein